jgi:hypothetical protein
VGDDIVEARGQEADSVHEQQILPEQRTNDMPDRWKAMHGMFHSGVEECAILSRRRNCLNVVVDLIRESWGCIARLERLQQMPSVSEGPDLE